MINRHSPGLVLAALSPMHVDGLVTFCRAARRTGRTFVVDPLRGFRRLLAEARAHGVPLDVYLQSVLARARAAEGVSGQPRNPFPTGPVPVDGGFGNYDAAPPC